jgi:hypothetical protein
MPPSIEPAEEEPMRRDALEGFHLGDFWLMSHICNERSRDVGRPFAGKSGVFILHFLRDLIPFCEACENLGLTLTTSTFFYKEYLYPHLSAVREWLRQKGAIVRPLADVDAFLEGLATGSHDVGNRDIVVVEDGGYLVPKIVDKYPRIASRAAGAVEQTTKGLRAAEAVAERLTFPLLSVAGCRVKGDYEPTYIARDILFQLRRLAGLDVLGRHVAVLGYGTIGRQVALELIRAGRATVHVYDPDPSRTLLAREDGGMMIHDTVREAVADARVVIGTTGRQSIDATVFHSLRHGVFLISASSDQVEIDIVDLQSRAQNSLPLHSLGDGLVMRIGTKYILGDNTINVLADGRPINFWDFESMPRAPSDLIMTIMFLCASEAGLRNGAPAGIDAHTVDELVRKYALERELQRHYMS